MTRQAIVCVHLLLLLVPASATIDWGRRSSPFLPIRFAGRYVYYATDTPLPLLLRLPRGGSDYSEYEDDVDDEEPQPNTIRRNTSRPLQSQDERTASSPIPSSHRRSAPVPPSRHRNPSPTRTSTSGGTTTNVWTSMARKSVQLGTSLVTGTAQQTGKAAYYLVQPKHVDRRELLGLWRIDQQWNDGRWPAEHLNIELTARGDVVVSTPEQGTRSPPTQATSSSAKRPPPSRLAPWKFTPAQWPKRAKIEFRMGPSLLYKCTVHRKLAAKNVLKLRGKIYQLEKTGWRGRTTSQVLVGTFVARRRLRLDDDDEGDDEDDDEEYDDEEEPPRDLNAVPDDLDDVDRESDDALDDGDEGAYYDQEDDQ